MNKSKFYNPDFLTVQELEISVPILRRAQLGRNGPVLRQVVLNQPQCDLGDIKWNQQNVEHGVA